MFYLKNAPTIYADVDDTLIIWGFSYEDPNVFHIADECGHLYVKGHFEHMKYLRKKKQEGWNIIVWSHGGSDHAYNAVKALNLENLVDAIVPKPHLYMDDLKVNEFMPECNRVYIPYKKKKDSVEYDNKAEVLLGIADDCEHDFIAHADGDMEIQQCSKCKTTRKWSWN